MTTHVTFVNHTDMVRQIAESSAPGRSAVAASWRRSLMHHQLDPAEARRPERVTQDTLRARREAAQDLMRVAGPILNRLAAAAMDTGSAVILSGPDGLILEERIRAADSVDFGSAGLAAGASWAEADEGTNGIGTCLTERRPVVIWNDQHFHVRNLALTCMGAPIEAPDGGLAGVVDISSCRRDLNEAQARLIGLTVQDAAVRIGCELFSAAFPGARIIVMPGDPAHGPCQIAVDRDDLILGCNRAARRTFGITNQDIALRRPAADVLRAGAEIDARGGLKGALRSEVLRALHRAGGNVTAAARDLRIGRATLYRKIKDLGLRGEREN
ncbi:MAG TPA: GAF domain-containing protein [Paenirhodobacter sp.]